MKAFAWALIAIPIAAYFGIPWEMERRDLARMRDDLRQLGAERWIDAPGARANIEYVFTGSAARFYKFQIPPGEASAFLSAAESGWLGPTRRRNGASELPTSQALKWWRPDELRNVDLLELQKGRDPEHAWTLWRVAVSRESGDVYVHRQGH